VHLIGNMWFLLIFGRNVELAMRQGLFLGFYFTCGVMSGLADVLVSPTSVVPYLGASGAISGVMGAYFFIFPLNKIKVWFGWVWVFELPTFIVVGLWFLIQYASTALAITFGDVHTGIAYWSHVAGFLTGIAFILITLAILKYQQQFQPSVEEQEEAAAAEALTQPTEADKLFARAEQEREKAKVDMIANCLPEQLPAPKEKSLTSR
jgi:membrane associated rhomboid family serine protease